MQTSSPSNSPPPSVERYLRARHGPGALVTMADFVRAALYAPEVGYYRRSRPRVGHAAGRDFYTAESLGPVFAALVVAAVEKMLPAPAAAFTFVELGAENPGGMLAGRSHPFADVRAVGAGEPIALAGPCVVFSNELFDAQPFRRFEARNGQWIEHGVRLGENGLMPALLEDPRAIPPDLPAPPSDGYLYDYPSGAGELLEQILSTGWHGLFLAFDYGLDRETLAHYRPGGTARTYFQHTQGDDLLATPGERDITHHVCWDRLRDRLQAGGCGGIELCSQESFFMRHSVTAIERIVAQAAQPGVHAEVQTLKQLLHPENMGRKFQVLSGFRSENTCQGPENA